MKKLFLFLLPVFIVSCTEEGELFITLSDKSATMFYDGTKQLTIHYGSNSLKSKTYNYTTSDSTIVSVSKTGLVSGVSIGTATIKVASTDGKYSDECVFRVSPKSTLYTEPYTVFGSTISTVKSKEAREVSHEIIIPNVAPNQNDTTIYVVYTDTNPNVTGVWYSFKNGKLIYAGVNIRRSQSSATEVSTFLAERYKYFGPLIYKDRKSGIGVTFMDKTNDSQSSVTYAPTPLAF